MRVSFEKPLRWFANLPVALVAAHSLFAGTVLSSTEAAGWNTWGHETSIVMVVPILAWAVARWWSTQRHRPVDQ